MHALLTRVTDRIEKDQLQRCYRVFNIRVTGIFDPLTALPTTNHFDWPQMALLEISRDIFFKAIGDVDSR
jgi:hypothetical protein